MKLYFSIFLFIAILPGCKTLPSSTGIRDLTLHETIKEMVFAYENEEINRFLRYITPLYEGGFQTFEEDVRDDFEHSSNIRIRYEILNESIRGNFIYVNINWKKSEVETPDADRDGMEDNWEIRFKLDPDNPSDAVLDSDGDGFSNLQEYQGNTDPRDNASIPTATVNRTEFSDIKREWDGTSILVFSTDDGIRFAGFQGDKLFGQLETTGR